MKKEIKVVAIVLAALIIFLSGFGIGATKGINVNVKYEGAAGEVAAPAPTTQAPQTTAPTTQAPTEAPTQAPAGDDATDAPTQAPAGDSKVPSTPAEVVAAYNKAVNGTKNYKGSCHFKKESVISIQVTDCPGGAAIAKAVQPVIDKLAGSSTWEADYNNGVNDADGQLYNALTPGDRDAALTEEACASATAVAAGDGYKMTVVINPEKSTYDGTNTTYPVYHQQITNPLNLAEINADPIVITAADMSYAGATVEVTVDGEGRVTLMTLKMPIEGSGTGKAGFINATIGIAGSLDDTYTITY